MCRACRMRSETRLLNRKRGEGWQQVGEVARAVVSRSWGLGLSQAASAAPSLRCGPPDDCPSPQERGAGND